MTESRDRSAPTRREFLRLAAAAGIAGAIAPQAAAFAQSAAPPPAQPPAPPAEPEAPSEAAKALTSVLQDRLGKDRLTDEQWAGVTKDFDGDLAVAKRLAAHKLANGDEPDFVFFAQEP